MRVLLDTHTFIWWDNDRARLSSKAYEICQDNQNTLYLSLASIWEIQIKIQLGKLSLPLALPAMVANQVQQNDLELLPVSPEHIYALDNLAMHHKDPFDRILIAQAQIESLDFLSADAKIRRYPISVIW